MFVRNSDQGDAHLGILFSEWVSYFGSSGYFIVEVAHRHLEGVLLRTTSVSWESNLLLPTLATKQGATTTCVRTDTSSWQIDPDSRNSPGSNPLTYSRAASEQRRASRRHFEALETQTWLRTWSVLGCLLAVRSFRLELLRSMEKCSVYYGYFKKLEQRCGREPDVALWWPTHVELNKVNKSWAKTKASYSQTRPFGQHRRKGEDRKQQERDFRSLKDKQKIQDSIINVLLRMRQEVEPNFWISFPPKRNAEVFENLFHRGRSLGWIVRCLTLSRRTMSPNPWSIEFFVVLSANRTRTASNGAHTRTSICPLRHIAHNYKILKNHGEFILHSKKNAYCDFFIVNSYINYMGRPFLQNSIFILMPLCHAGLL